MVETETSSAIKGDFSWRVPRVRGSFIDGPDAEELLKEFNGKADADYRGNSILKVLTYDRGIVKGSNPFAVVLINQLLRANDLPIRTATPADLGSFVDSGMLPLRGYSEDVALVVRTGKDSYEPNVSLTQDLVKQLKARGVTPKAKNPIMIPLDGLDLVNANNPYGLAFKLGNYAEFIKAPPLVGKNHLKRFLRTGGTGLPLFNIEGNRVLYTSKDALSRLYLDTDLGLRSRWGELDDSSLGGRIVLVGGEGDAGDFFAQLQTSADQERKKLAERYKQANAALEAGSQQASKILKGE